ncbi:hypothetical protein GLYMA_10G156800v4 [Glycine max]|uniref:Uncharacterized protein n=1 Tax=Glycine max TaxID=3847 RepID=A0A0R0HTQ9_SOYBN|nr:hypothetical protein GLYMA_10G156800v4 [Glycine max]
MKTPSTRSLPALSTQSPSPTTTISPSPPPLMLSRPLLVLRQPHQQPVLSLRVACDHPARQPLLHFLRRRVAA